MAAGQLLGAILLFVLSLIGAILQQLNSDGEYCSYGWNGSKYSYYCYYIYNYHGPSMVMLGILGPILGFIHMIMLSISCYELWKGMRMKAQEMMQRSQPAATHNPYYVYAPQQFNPNPYAYYASNPSPAQFDGQQQQQDASAPPSYEL